MEDKRQTNSDELSSMEKDALCGRLTREAFNETGMSLFQKGLVQFDPLTGDYELTEKGVTVAKQLRVS